MSDTARITTLLGEMRAGDERARERLVTIVYADLRRMAARYLRNERPGHTLQPTALVHEGFLRLFGGAELALTDRAHFFAVAATQMRRILVDHARASDAKKRGGGRVKVSLTEASGIEQSRDEDLLAVDEALTALESVDPRAARIVELRFFAGLGPEEAAQALGISTTTLKRDWRSARAWLFSRLQSLPGGETRRSTAG
jgi:RNA polymerase sigma-70 factor (ECF subfamily)